MEHIEEDARIDFDLISEDQSRQINSLTKLIQITSNGRDISIHFSSIVLRGLSNSNLAVIPLIDPKHHTPNYTKTVRLLSYQALSGCYSIREKLHLQDSFLYSPVDNVTSFPPSSTTFLNSSNNSNPPISSPNSITNNANQAQRNPNQPISLWEKLLDSIVKDIQSEPVDPELRSAALKALQILPQQIIKVNNFILFELLKSNCTSSYQ